MNRREFVAALAALGGCATTGGPLLAGTPIGIQLYALGPEAQNDLDATFGALAAIGYQSVEVSVGRRTGPEVRAALDRVGLTCPSIHPEAFRGTETPDMSGAIAFANAVGARTVALSIFPFLRPFAQPAPGQGYGEVIAGLARSYSADEWTRIYAMLNDAGRQCQRAGLQFGYHNHNVDLAPLNGTRGETTILDALLANTDPELVCLQADVGWVAAAGVDIPSFLERHRARLRSLHVKDITSATTPNFALNIQTTEIGSGVVDWPRVLRTALECGVREFYVEQEPPYTRPTLDSARISYGYLRGLA